MRNMAKRILVAFIFTVAIFTILYLLPQCPECTVGKAVSVGHVYSVTVNNPTNFTLDIPNFVFSVGDIFEYDVNCTDKDNLTFPISYSDDTPLFNINSATGLINKSFSTFDVGVWTIKITCGDTLGSATKNFTVTVNTIAVPPSPPAPPSPGGGGGGGREIVYIEKEGGVSEDTVKTNDEIDKLIKEIKYSLGKIDMAKNVETDKEYADIIGITKSLDNANQKLQEYVDVLEQLKKSKASNEERLAKTAELRQKYYDVKSKTILRFNLVRKGDRRIFDNVVIIDPRIGMRDIHFDILDRLDFTQEEHDLLEPEKALSPVSVILGIDTLDVAYLDEEKGQRTVVSSSIVNLGDTTVNNLYAIVNVPKEISQNANEMEYLPDNYEIVRQDPIIRWRLDNFESNEIKSFSTLFKTQLTEEQASKIKFIVAFGRGLVVEGERIVVETPGQQFCWSTFLLLILLFLLLIIVAQFLPHDKEHHRYIRTGFAILMTVNLILMILSFIYIEICRMLSIIVLFELILLLLAMLMIEKICRTLQPENTKKTPLKKS